MPPRTRSSTGRGTPGAAEAAAAPSRDSGSSDAAAATREAFRLLDDACLRGGPTGQLAENLRAAGALDGGAGANPVALYSQRVVDTLPKHWGGRGPAAIPEQLTAKANSHAVLLDTLQHAGVLDQLPPAALRAVFEAGERLHAVAAVREVETKAAAQAQAAARPESAAGAASLLAAAIRRAGATCTPQVSAEVGARPPWEVFYACPSATAPAFLTAAAVLAGSAAAADGLQEAVQGAEAAPQPAADRLAALAVLARATRQALAAGGAQRQWHQQAAPAALNVALGGVPGPDWLAQPPARHALLAIAQAALQLQGQLQEEAPARAAEATAVAADAADRALNAEAAALAACEPGDASALQAEYGGAREALLAALLREAERLLRSGSEAAGGALLRRVESAAEAHGAYGQLFDVAALLGDAGRLYGHMAAFLGTVAPGWDQSAAAYTFDRLEAEGRASELLDVPDRFDADLTAWLAAPGAAGRRAGLAWLHQLRVQDYRRAAATLGGLPQGNLASAKRALALAKLSALAAGGEPAAGDPPAASAAAMEELDARLALLSLQEALGLGGQPPLEAPALAAAALAAGRPAQDAELALQVFAAAGPHFTASYRPMLEAAYTQLAEALQLPSLEFL